MQILKKIFKKIWKNRFMNFLKHKLKFFIVLIDLKLVKFKNFCYFISKKDYLEPKRNYNEIEKNFEKWISIKKSKLKIKDFIEEDFIPSKEDTSKYYAIQQVKKEIFEFVKIILNKSAKDSILEIGLGYYGGTHILWKLIFKKIITIEIDLKNVKRFLKNEMVSFRDIFIIGDSQNPKTFSKVKKIAKQVDVLFIDGDHNYESVKKDYLLYRKLVKKGGIIAFHDSMCEMEEIGFRVNSFLRDLQKGVIDGKKHILNHIIFSKAVGISWEIKE